MAEVVLTRIDNRLIHGQVATQWINEIGADLLLVANDELANDDFRQQLMNMAAPARVATRYMTLDDAVAFVNDENNKNHVFMITETPADTLALVEKGAPITAVNVGNMHMAEGKRQAATTVAVDDADVAVFNALKDKGIELFIQRTPGVVQEDVAKILG